MLMKTTDKLKILPALIVTAILALAPFIGGRDELFGTACLSIMAVASGILLLWSRRIARAVALWPFAAFVAILFLSAVVSASIHATIQTGMYFAGCAAAAVVASSVIRRDRWFTASLFCVVGAGLILGALGVREYVAHYRANEADWRVFATFLNPGFFGGYLVMAIPITLAAFLAVKSPAGVLGIGLAWAFEMAALFLTGTRFAIASAALALMVLAALAIWTRSVGRKHILRLAVAVGVAAVVIALSLAPTAIRVSGKDAAEQSHSGPFRVATWKGAVNIIRAHPVLGTGAGTFELVFPRYMVAGYARMAHNGYLEIASDAGVPALAAAGVAFVVLLVSGMRGLRKEEEPDLELLLPRGATLLACGAIAALTGSLARNLLDSDIYVPALGYTFWVLAGVVAARGAPQQMADPPKSVRVVVSALLALIGMVWMTFVVGQLRSNDGWTALENGEPFSAMESYRSATAIDPLFADHWLRLGQVTTMTSGGDDDQWREGVGYMRRAARLEPTRARNVIVLGRTLEAHGDTTDAVRTFRQALVLDPHATPAMLAAARLLEGHESDEMYRRILEEEKSPTERLRGVPELVNPDFAWAHYHFGEKDLRAGRTKQAAGHFRAVIERLERRKSYKRFLDAAALAGISQPEDEMELDQLLEDSKSALAKAESAESRGK